MIRQQDVCILASNVDNNHHIPEIFANLLLQRLHEGMVLLLLLLIVDLWLPCIYCLIHNCSTLMMLVTAPVEAPQSVPEMHQVFQETELGYSETQRDAIGHRFLWQQASGWSFALSQCLTARPLSSH